MPKKGDPRDCNNWRGVCVLPSVYKIIAKVILERIKEHLYNTIDAAQAGFKPGSSCADHINTIRIIIEQCAAFNIDLHLLFIDFEKAFDSVHRNCIWQVLKRWDIPDKIISIIKASYNGAKCRVLHNGKLSETFNVESGVRQGCILSPILFLLVVADVLDAAFSPLKSCGLRWSMPSNNNLMHLDYADDICNQLLSDEHIAVRIKKAQKSFGMMTPIWRNSTLSRRLKVRLFKSNVLSVLLYGCSTWKVQDSLTSKLKQMFKK